MQFATRYSLFLVGLTTLLMTTGCGGGGTARYGVTGKVTLDGEPVENGSIAFMSVDAPKPETAHGTIANGTYTVPKDRGPQPGKYQVMIHWPKPTGKEIVDTDSGNMVPVTEEAIPAKFNTETTLTVEFKGSETHDFELTTN